MVLASALAGCDDLRMIPVSLQHRYLTSTDAILMGCRLSSWTMCSQRCG